MQIGNAVPPLLAEVFGKYLADLIQETKQGSVNCIRNASEERETNDSLEILP